MVNLIDTGKFMNGQDISALEPSCGLAQFLIGIKGNHPSIYKKIQATGIELNDKIISYLNNLNVLNGIKLIHSDYLLLQAEQRFDLIIGNPPYGIPIPSVQYSIKIDKTILKRNTKIFMKLGMVNIMYTEHLLRNPLNYLSQMNNLFL